MLFLVIKIRLSVFKVSAEINLNIKPMGRKKKFMVKVTFIEATIINFYKQRIIW